MRRKEFYQIVSLLTDKLYTLAYSLLPDDLQAEQLVIDTINAFLIKEKKAIHLKEIDLQNKKEVRAYSKQVFKVLIRRLSEIGIRRCMQLTEQMKLTQPSEFSQFYGLDPKVRLVLRLRYDLQFSVDDIGDIFEIPRFQVIEKLHNGRFLLLNDLSQGEAT